MNYKKQLNTGNIIALISAIVSVVSCFVPFVKNGRASASYYDAYDITNEEFFKAFFYISLIGAIFVAVFSIAKINWAAILFSSLLLLSNGFLVLACIIAAQETKKNESLAIGFYLLAISTLTMFIFSIVGAVSNARAKNTFYTNGGNRQVQQPKYQQGAYGQVQQPQYQQGAYGQMQQPQYQQGAYGQMQQPQYQQGAYGQMQQPQYQQGAYGQMQQPQYQQGAYGQVQQPQYQQPQYQQTAPQQPAYQAAPQQQDQTEAKTSEQSVFNTPSFEDPQYDAQNYEAPEDEEVTLMLDQITGNNSQQ